MTSYRIEPLGKRDRSGFASGSDELDRYLLTQATQDMRRRVASCYVALDDEDRIAGYYTIAATSLLLDHLPAEQVRRLPRYPLIPAILLGRLAVSLDHRGQQLGSALLADVVLRVTRAEVMAYAIVVDAKDDNAVRFYEHFGFEHLAGEQLRLIRRL